MDAKINLKKTNILKVKKFNKDYDIIVSNPPYIELNEKNRMSRNVVDYEPHEAIFVTYHDPLIYYKKIILLAQQMKKNNSKIYFEINPKFCGDLKKYFLTTSFNDVVVQCDIFGKERMI